MFFKIAYTYFFEIGLALKEA